LRVGAERAWGVRGVDNNARYGGVKSFLSPSSDRSRDR
jgi:hypothetical protein